VFQGAAIVLALGDRRAEAGLAAARSSPPTSSSPPSAAAVVFLVVLALGHRR
jgi:hypothetical protein